MRFFTSDTHFGHANIIRYSNRPFKDVSHMNEVLIKNWNETVGPDDEVFHLGDVALGPWSEWDNVLTRLNGFKVLVVGNHDRVFKGMSTAQNERFYPLYAGWFDVVTDEVKNLRLSDGTMVNLSHFPYTGDSHDGDRYDEFRLADEGKTLIHGHTHAEFDKHGRDARVSRTAAGTLQVHVGQDAWGYRPVPEAEVIRLIQDES
jgi:calcineurin-like phosphoesterase family protein